MKLNWILAATTAITLAMGAAAHADDQKTLRFVWANVDPTETQAWNDYLISPFEKERPGVKINFEPTPDATNAVRVQANSPTGAPDLFMLDATEVSTYVAADLLLPLDKYVDQYNLQKLVFPWALNLGKVKGHYYAIPNEFEATLMIYNKDILDANGLTVPRTRAEFEHACDTLIAKGIVCVAGGTSGFVLGQQFLYDKYLSNYAGPAAIRDLFTGKIKFQDPTIRGAFELLKADWDKGYWNNKQGSSITMDQGRALFLSGKALILPEGTWFQSNVANGGVKFNWQATSWPSMKDGVPSASSIAVGAVVSVSKYTKSPDDAGALLGYMYQHPDLLAEGVAHGLAPRSTPFDFSKLPADVDKDSRHMLEVLFDVTKDPKNVSYAPWAFYPTKTNEYLMQNLDAMFFEQMSMDDFLNGAQAALDKELADGFVFGAPAD